MGIDMEGAVNLVLQDLEQQILTGLSKDEHYKNMVLTIQELRETLEGFCPKNEIGQFIKLNHDIAAIERMMALRKGMLFGLVLCSKLRGSDLQGLLQNIDIGGTETTNTEPE